MADLDYTYGFANPAAGPVYIEGAEPATCSWSTSTR